jgi:hypothetical protein
MSALAVGRAFCTRSYNPMMNMRTDRQITVASVLLLLLAAFAIDPPEHRCRTQSTRNRQARTVRVDDQDGDHNRWHAYGFDNSGRDTQSDDRHGLIAAATPPGYVAPVLEFAGFVLSFSSPFALRTVFERVRGRAPPVSL